MICSRDRYEETWLGMERTNRHSYGRRCGYSLDFGYSMSTYTEAFMLRERKYCGRRSAIGIFLMKALCFYHSLEALI